MKRLEYRGYDSWGIVTNGKLKVENGKLFVEKHVGKIGQSILNSQFSILNSNVALGHTRWATHGGVTEVNAHPHLDCNGQIAVVQNGIIENYQKLKKELLIKGHVFKSETDAEVAVHLVEEFFKSMNFREAVRQAFNKILGLNVFVFLNLDGEVVIAKNGSPLVVGLAKDGNFLASDPSAILPHTKKAVFIEDGEIAQVGHGKVKIFDTKSDKEKKIKVVDLKWRFNETSLGSFPHFMLKEIYEQPQVLRSIALKGQAIKKMAAIIKRGKGTFFIGCGTASYAALSGTYLFSEIAKKHVNFAIGSEFGYLEHYLDKQSLVFAISQSGETIDVVQPVKRAKEKGAKIVALTNVLGSSLYRLADYKILLGAGSEKAVCATKSFTAMVAHLVFLSFTIADKFQEGKKILEAAAGGIEKILNPDYIEKIKRLAKKLSKTRDIYIIGRGLSYAAALEATLKLKEVSYLHSEGFAAGELKHGVIALIEKGTLCIVFAPCDETYDDVISNAIEVKARGGYIIGISPKKNEIFDFYLPVADVSNGSVIVDIVPIQLLTYYIALEKGFDPDKPRNLAKSVTVK